MALVLLLLGHSLTAAHAQEAGPSASAERESPARTSVKLEETEALQLVRHLIAAGRLDEAQQVLTVLRPMARDRTEVLFLLGQVHGARGDHSAAIVLYRDLLARQPDLLRVRLELARALFLEKQDEAALYHFRFVLAADPPQQVRGNIERFVSLIRQRKRWSVSVSMAAAPDTNINTATDQRRVQLFGLPFELSDETLRTSGLGISGAVAAGYLFPGPGSAQLETRGEVRRTEFLDGGEFDDSFVGLQAGPRWASRQHVVSVLATAWRRWFSNAGLSRSAGTRIAYSRDLTQNVSLSALFAAEYIDFDRLDEQDGVTLSTFGQLSFGIDAVSVGRGFVGVAREQADASALRNTRFRFGLGYRREFPFGLSVDVFPELLVRPFDAPLAIFDETRFDLTYIVGADVTKRDWTLWGFAPVAGYSFTRNDSNLDFFDFTRHRGRFGLTRTF